MSEVSYQRCHVRGLRLEVSYQRCHIRGVISEVSYQRRHIRGVISEVSYQRCEAIGSHVKTHTFELGSDRIPRKSAYFCAGERQESSPGGVNLALDAS